MTRWLQITTTTLFVFCIFCFFPVSYVSAQQAQTTMPTMAGITAVTSGQSRDQDFNPFAAFSTIIQTIISFGQCPDGPGNCSTLVDINRYAKKTTALIKPSLTKAHQDILVMPQSQPGYEFPREQYFSEPCEGHSATFETSSTNNNAPVNVAHTVQEERKPDADQTEGMFVFGGTVGSSKRPNSSGITLNITAKYPKIYDENDKLTNESIQMPCGAQSQGVRATPTPAQLEGSNALGQGNTIQLNASLDSVRNFVLGSITCLTLSEEGENCRAQILSTTTMTVYSAGDLASFCITSECSNVAFSANADPAELENVRAQKGAITGLMMTKQTRDQTRMVPEQSHGLTPSNANATSDLATGADLPHQFGAQKIRDLQLGMDCAPLPKSLQDRYRMTYCNSPTQTETLSCDTNTPVNLNFTISESACGITDINRASQLVGYTIPQNLINIINKAADTFKVPGSVILATIYHEGAFSRGLPWDDSYVQQYSACGAEIKECTTAYNNGSAAIPFGWYKTYFLDAGSSPYAAVQSVDPNRSRNEVSACNVLDGIFATAKSLHIWAGARGGYSRNITACQGYQLQDGPAPSTCAAWNNAKVVQAMMGYNGYCPGAGTYPRGDSRFPLNNPFAQQGVSFFNALK